LKALILAGGFGKRLRPLTEEVPKPLIPIAGRPILEYQIEWLSRNGVSEVVLCVGYLWEKIRQRLGREWKGIKIEYSVEEEPLGTGGALKAAREHVMDAELFIALNGDVITNLEVKPLVSEARGVLGAIAMVQLRSPYGIVLVNSESRVLRFIEKPILRDYWINAGVYCLKPEALDYMPERGDLEKTAFPKLAEEGKLKAVKYTGVYWRSIDTYKDLEEASRDMREGRYRL